MVQSCRHILGEGTQCAAPALRNKFFCRHHNGVHDWQRRSGLRSQIKPQTQTFDYGAIPVSETPAPQVYPPIELEYPEDRVSIQTNLYRIADALARGRADRSTATALLYAMQVCQTNLGKRPLIEALSASRPIESQDRSQSGSQSEYTDQPAGRHALRTVHRVILTPDGDEIAPPMEILEDNEAEPIHHRLCPCLLCAEKYRNQSPEEHHPDCQCGLCEEQEPPTNDVILSEATAGSGVEGPAVSQASPTNDAILSEATAGSGVEGPAVSQALPNNDVILSEVRNACGVEGPAVSRPGNDKRSCRPRIARASALLSGSTSRDPLNRPWSVAEYTFGDAIRRHEAQYAARAAAALAAGIEPPPYKPYVTGLIRPGTPEHAEDQQMQQHSDEYWSAHFRAQIAERPDIQQYLAEQDEELSN